jgi:hypothetical protein
VNHNVKQNKKIPEGERQPANAFCIAPSPKIGSARKLFLGLFVAIFARCRIGGGDKAPFLAEKHVRVGRVKSADAGSRQPHKGISLEYKSVQGFEILGPLLLQSVSLFVGHAFITRRKHSSQVNLNKNIASQLQMKHFVWKKTCGADRGFQFFPGCMPLLPLLSDMAAADGIAGNWSEEKVDSLPELWEADFVAADAAVAAVAAAARSSTNTMSLSRKSTSSTLSHWWNLDLNKNGSVPYFCSEKFCKKNNEETPGNLVDHGKLELGRTRQQLRQLHRQTMGSGSKKTRRSISHPHKQIGIVVQHKHCIRPQNLGRQKATCCQRLSKLGVNMRI